MECVQVPDRSEFLYRIPLDLIDGSICESGGIGGSDYEVLLEPQTDLSSGDGAASPLTHHYGLYCKARQVSRVRGIIGDPGAGSL